MPIKTKTRINISVAPEINKTLVRLAERDRIPVATKALELIKKALQIEEDDILNLLAEERDTKSAQYISHKKAWARFTR